MNDSIFSNWIQATCIEKYLNIYDQNSLSLWYFDSNKTIELAKKYIGILGPEEIYKASKIKHKARWQSYISSHILLRVLISQFTQCGKQPKEWKIEQNKYGKPYLNNKNYSHINFNISYSNAIISIGIAKKSHIGIDIEHITPTPTQEIPWHLLTKSEIQYLLAIPSAEQYIPFIEIWSLKEAYAKATGRGSDIDFKSISCTLQPLQIQGSEGFNRKLTVKSQKLHINTQTYISSIICMDKI